MSCPALRRLNSLIAKWERQDELTSGPPLRRSVPWGVPAVRRQFKQQGLVDHRVRYRTTQTQELS